MEHELTHDELVALKELKQRRRVSTGDAPLLNEIYGRMTPGYTICETCVETLAAEANSLILYAEKQIGGSLLDYTSEEANDQQNAKTQKVANKRGRKKGKKVAEAVKIQAVDGVLNTPGLKEAIGNEGPKELADMTNPEIVAHVLEKTGIELSEHAEREDLIASATDLLIDYVGETAGPPAAKVQLHKNGLVSTKGEVIYAYVKQEKGIELKQGLSRPDLLKAASEALGLEK